MPVDHEIDVPRKMDAPIHRVYLTKVGFLLLSFVLIGSEILGRNLT